MITTKEILFIAQADPISSILYRLSIKWSPAQPAVYHAAGAAFLFLLLLRVYFDYIPQSILYQLSPQEGHAMMLDAVINNKQHHHWSQYKQGSYTGDPFFYIHAEKNGATLEFVVYRMTQHGGWWVTHCTASTYMCTVSNIESIQQIIDIYFFTI